MFVYFLTFEVTAQTYLNITRFEVRFYSIFNLFHNVCLVHFILVISNNSIILKLYRNY